MIKTEEFKLIGLPLETKTTNNNGQSAIDCGNLWQKFITGDYAEKIPGKSGKEIFAVYHSYEGDHTGPFSIPRAYLADYEVYGEKSKDWNTGEIDIFISVE
jgi:predicted transcriptional regulator YdeE